MKNINILEYMKDNLLYLDGGFGTMLHKEGITPGELPETWNISHSNVITSIHKRYFDAGCNVVNANTFGANSLKFNDDDLEKIICAAIDNAKKARDKATDEKPRYIALDIGPTGRLLKPYGDLLFEDAVECFAKTVKLGVKYGADLIFIETMNDSYETKAALLAAKENSDLPVFVCNAYSEDGKLMTGATPKAMVALLEGMGADAIGANCSLGPAQLKGVIKELLEESSIPVILKPNAGLPKSVDGQTIYDVSEEDFAKEVKERIKDGVRIIGGCCGTTPNFIKHLVDETKDIIPKDVKQKNKTIVSSYTHTVEFSKRPVLIGERINPTGKKRFKTALIENDISYILKEAINQQQCGVDVLDVNVGLPEIDEEKMLKTAVGEIQAVVNLPLQIDTADAKAMESALRCYNGKAMINSVNGNKESMLKIFPLVKKYGGVVVALTLDENGIPKTAEGRFEIAEKILKTAHEYGIKPNDIIFDTLAMTVSAEPTAALTAVKAISLIKNKLGCCTSLGVSNVSFGLPSRDAINSAFYLSALENGLSAAIINPYSNDLMKAHHAFLALHAMDENCGKYIEFMTNIEEENSADKKNINKIFNAKDDKSNLAEGLKNAVENGLKENAGEIAEELLKTTDPLDIINKSVIPALDTVGIGFEKKKIYLPQLLMSAEAASEAFEKVKSNLANNDNNQTNKCKFVIATVHGDIHDIGKNIVKLLLENYGFDCIDLGRDVPPETVLNAVRESNAPLVGLSVLMTTTVPAMEETIKLLRREVPWVKIVVGGAVLTEDYAKSIGADKYAKDAMETVRYAEMISDMLN